MLDAAPTAAVTISAAKAEGNDADLTVSPPFLTFTTDDWSTAQTVTVTAADDDDAADGTATIAHTASGGGYDSVIIASVTATEDDNDEPNAAPTFSSGASFSVAENTTTVGTVTATDADASDSITSYAISGGADQGKFSIDTNTGALIFASAPNYEAPADAVSTTPANAAGNNEYIVEVRATSGTIPRVLTATQTITVTVTNVGGEAPSAPSAPTISAVTASGFTVSWTAPANPGPAITAYAVQYRVSGGTWTDAGHSGTGLSVAVTGLTANTSYEVQVKATNDEGTSAWSAAATATTTAAANAAPTFSSGASFSVAENTTTVGTVTATDADASDSITSYAISGGADQGKFSIDTNTGALIFASAPNYEAPADAVSTTPANAAGNNEYIVEVRATSGTIPRVLTATQTITVTVTDVGGEAPSAPSAPTISSVTAGGFTVSWTAPANPGPAITAYAVQYRVSGGTWTDAGHSGTGLSVAVTGLTANTSYEVQVKATNDEGTSAWSAAATAAANAAPTFGSAASFSVAENATTVGTVVATDADASDSITSYAISGGADQGKFSIDTNTGALIFASAPNYEAPADAVSTTPANAAGNNEYIVEVRATSGTSPRVLTATQTITVTVTDVGGEAPSAPSAPTISAETATGFTVTWTEPANTGPAITDYAVQYRVSGDTAWTAASHSGTGLTVTLTGLTASTSYEVQVQATNDEGTSAWSAAATATTTVALGVTVSDTALTVDEDDSATYTLVLDAAPTAAVTIAVATADGDDADLTLSAPSLTFTTSNWNTAQTVTVSAAADDDTADGTATITHTASSADSGYSGIIIDSLKATENDDDTVGVTVDPETLSITEESTASYGRESGMAMTGAPF